MHSYSVGVALFDYLPVLASAFGLICLALAIGHRHHALRTASWLAAALIILGGLCKASWKLIIALQAQDIVWLSNLLFIFLAPGFFALSFSMFHASRAWRAGVSANSASFPADRLALWSSLPLLIGLVAYAVWPQTRIWFFCLLGLTTLANASLLLQAFKAAHWSGLPLPVLLCFVYNFAATVSLSGLARLSPGEASAWIQQSVNLSAQLALAIGCWQLARRMQEKPV